MRVIAHMSLDNIGYLINNYDLKDQIKAYTGHIGSASGLRELITFADKRGSVKILSQLSTVGHMIERNTRSTKHSSGSALKPRCTVCLHLDDDAVHYTSGLHNNQDNPQLSLMLNGYISRPSEIISDIPAGDCVDESELMLVNNYHQDQEMDCNQQRVFNAFVSEMLYIDQDVRLNRKHLSMGIGIYILDLGAFVGIIVIQNQLDINVAVSVICIFCAVLVIGFVSELRLCLGGILKKNQNETERYRNGF